MKDNDKIFLVVLKTLADKNKWTRVIRKARVWVKDGVPELRLVIRIDMKDGKDLFLMQVASLSRTGTWDEEIAKTIRTVRNNQWGLMAVLTKCASDAVKANKWERLARHEADQAAASAAEEMKAIGYEEITVHHDTQEG